MVRLEELARALLAADPNVCEVRLFGSLAADTYTARSDADLLIVLETGAPRRMDRIPALLAHFRTAPIPVDILPYTRAELEAALAAGDRFVERILNHSILLAGRDGCSTTRPVAPADGNGPST
jgi:predicted nucleotidyltransferase